jgi:hypothetical protein
MYLRYRVCEVSRLDPGRRIPRRLNANQECFNPVELPQSIARRISERFKQLFARG